MEHHQQFAISLLHAKSLLRKISRRDIPFFYWNLEFVFQRMKQKELFIVLLPLE